MENKRPRGRPATGRERDIKITLRVSESEKDAIRKAQKKHNKNSIADLILYLLEK